MDVLKTVLESVTGFCIPVFEIIATVVVAITVVTSFINYIRSLCGKASAKPEHKLAKGLSLSLEFLMAAEILKTVTLRETEELVILAAVIILRVLFSFLVQFEMKQTNKIDHQEGKS